MQIAKERGMQERSSSKLYTGSNEKYEFNYEFLSFSTKFASFWQEK